jgi:hypothetical protein
MQKRKYKAGVPLPRGPQFDHDTYEKHGPNNNELYQQFVYSFEYGRPSGPLHYPSRTRLPNGLGRQNTIQEESLEVRNKKPSPPKKKSPSPKPTRSRSTSPSSSKRKRSKSPSPKTRRSKLTK